jgi:adenylate cyclase
VQIVGPTSQRELASARAGLALGSVLARGGDYFGLPVNVASRLVDRADSGAVAADEHLKEALMDGFTLEPMGSQRLKALERSRPGSSAEHPISRSTGRLSP